MLFIHVHKIVRLKDVGFSPKLNYFFYRKPDPNNDSGNDVGLVIAVSSGIILILSAMALLIFFLWRRSSKISLFALLEK